MIRRSFISLVAGLLAAKASPAGAVGVGGCSCSDFRVFGTGPQNDKVQGSLDISCPADRRVQVSVLQDTSSGWTVVPGTPRSKDYPDGTGGDEPRSDVSNDCASSSGRDFAVRVRVYRLSTGELLEAHADTGSPDRIALNCV